MSPERCQASCFVGLKLILVYNVMIFIINTVIVQCFEVELWGSFISNFNYCFNVSFFTVITITLLSLVRFWLVRCVLLSPPSLTFQPQSDISTPVWHFRPSLTYPRQSDISAPVWHIHASLTFSPQSDISTPVWHVRPSLTFPPQSYFCMPVWPLPLSVMLSFYLFIKFFIVLALFSWCVAFLFCWHKTCFTSFPCRSCASSCNVCPLVQAAVMSVLLCKQLLCLSSCASSCYVCPLVQAAVMSVTPALSYLSLLCKQQLCLCL
jgi:hypothetical protein